MISSLTHGAKPSQGCSRVNLQDREEDREIDFLGEWEPKDYPKGSNLWSLDLEAVRRWYQAKGIQPKCLFKSEHKLSRISAKGVFVRAFDANWESVRSFCERASIPWRGQGLGSALVQAAMDL